MFRRLGLHPGGDFDVRAAGTVMSGPLSTLSRQFASRGEAVDWTLAGARERFQESLDIARAIAARHEEAESWEGLGRCASHTTSAAAALRQAFEIYRRISSPRAHALAEELADS